MQCHTFRKGILFSIKVTYVNLTVNPEDTQLCRRVSHRCVTQNINNVCIIWRTWDSIPLRTRRGYRHFKYTPCTGGTVKPREWGHRLLVSHTGGD